MPSPQPKLRLPQIERVALRRFSLFTANPNAEFTCGEGVLCIVGANGIGKSTLLSAINFCITGIVPDPNRSFKSMDEYYRFSRDFSSRYFRGRIDGNDEDEAEITLSFRLGSYIYEVQRGMFETDELRAFTITNRDDSTIVLETENFTRGERHKAYALHLVEDSGASSFEEFVFLQHFVFTFDENRRTLFWNQGVLERALYRAFGWQLDMAKQADNFRREIDKEDSNVRNRQWDATRLRKRINEIRAKAQAASGARQSFDTLIGDHEALTRQFDEECKVLHELEAALKDSNLRLAELSVRETALRDEYARYFDSRFDIRPPLMKHPLITQSLDECVCGLCGNGTEAAIANINAKAEATICPLCDSPLSTEVSSSLDTSRLQEIDRELAQTKQYLRDVLKTAERLRAEETKARQKFDSTKEKLDEFDRQNSATLEGLRKLLNSSDSNVSLNDYRTQLASLEKEKTTAYKRREALKQKLLELQSSLEKQYIQAEEIFVPRFAELAKRFLGMPLTVKLEAREAVGLNLIVTVNGNTRRQQQQLSESQRFFLDIALRMALTEHMSDPNSRGGMFIDTPEGSLDIAYEKRAGDMLAMFAEAGHRIVMTANLNTSQLLLALAHRCRKKWMTLCRMTDWAELSDVQKEEEDLFDKAYQAIEKAMEPDVI
ncbi:MAG TPA: AAA family ATPase [Desulfatiglandales bacterium]|nr:AAA family ATPase [Desulfatiglandales bacterium]